MNNAAAGLPHGGRESVLFGDSHMPTEKKERLIRCFATALKEEEMRAFCKGEMAHFHVPKYICFVSELPMTVTGKL